MKKALPVVVGVVAGSLAPGVAHAETPPGCASARQIRATTHVKLAGCGKNRGYVFVWADWASRHTLFHVTTDDGKVVGALNDREVWSRAMSTIDPARMV